MTFQSDQEEMAEFAEMIRREHLHTYESSQKRELERLLGIRYAAWPPLPAIDVAETAASIDDPEHKSLILWLQG